MTRTTVWPLGALVGSGARWLARSPSWAGWPRWRVRWFVGSLVVSLAWLVGSAGVLVASLVASVASLVSLLACSPAGSHARCVGAFFGRRLPAVVYLGHDPHHGSWLYTFVPGA